MDTSCLSKDPRDLCRDLVLAIIYFSINICDTHKYIQQ